MKKRLTRAFRDGYGRIMAAMSDEQRDAFLAERRLGTLGIARVGKGPLLAPIWYRYTPGEPIEMNMGGSSAKAFRLRAEGRATLSVIDDTNPYRYVTAEGPVTLTLLGESTYDAIRSMASRYLGTDAGTRYADAFRTPDEVVVRLTVENWQALILG
jgi:PPOX class probable F420-dependent enzyme